MCLDVDRPERQDDAEVACGSLESVLSEGLLQGGGTARRDGGHARPVQDAGELRALVRADVPGTIASWLSTRRQQAVVRLQPAAGARVCVRTAHVVIHASGASARGPGNSSSSRVRTSCGSVRSNAATAPSSCSTLRGPITGAVTPGRDSTQARPT